MNVMQAWKKHEKRENQMWDEIENGFKYIDGNTLLWNEKMYQGIQDYFSDCRYVYPYVYYGEKEKRYYYYIDFLYQNKELRIEVLEVKQGSSLLLESNIVCFNERWKEMSDEELCIILKKFEFIKKYVCSLQKYRVKHLMKNIMKKEYPYSVEIEMQTRRLIVT
jgi:hypothetical protein